MNKYNKLPLKYIAVTAPFGQDGNRFHYGVDLGWSSSKGGPNVNIYSMNDGIVTQKGYNNSAGNYIWIQTDMGDTRYLHRYLHLNAPAKVNIGDKVVRGQTIGNMGTTGDSTGPHLHFELWKCPKNYKFNWNDREKYAVNPLDYVYLFYDQTTSESSKNKVIKVVGTNIIKTRNKEINQIEVINQNLRCRKDYGLDKEILGYIDLGLYNVLDIKEKDNYKWYKINTNMWIAGTTDTKYYQKEEKVEEQPVETPQEEPKENLIKFIAKESGYYYIYLEKDEYVYYEKKE